MCVWSGEQFDLDFKSLSGEFSWDYKFFSGGCGGGLVVVRRSVNDDDTGGGGSQAALVGGDVVDGVGCYFAGVDERVFRKLRLPLCAE
jgi:hypothetical protein